MSEEQVQSTEQTTQPVEQPVQQTTEQVVSTDRPTWLNEKFKTGEDLQNAYNELQSKLGKGKDELVKEIEQELTDEINKNRPATAGDYTVPETLDPNLVTDNALFNWWKDTAYENGYSQQEFEDGIKVYIDSIATQTEETKQNEMKAMGENANARIEAVELWSKNYFPSELQESILELSTSANGIKTLEYIMNNNKQTQMATNSAPASKVSREYLEQLMMKPEYYDPARRQQAVVDEVQQGWQMLNSQTG